MTYELWINDVFFNETRDHSLAFAWFGDWLALGCGAVGLKFEADRKENDLFPKLFL
jgi:hypothetical protein